MNLTTKFLIESIGIAPFENLKIMKNVANFLKTYIHPIMFGLLLIMNLFVGIVCTMIYKKSKEKRNKQAFIFIGALAYTDFLLIR